MNPWWSVRKNADDDNHAAPPAEDDPHDDYDDAQQPAQPSMPPGWSFTITPPPQPQQDPREAQAEERRRRRRIWLGSHVVSAAIGWYLGLAKAAEGFLDDMGPSAPAAGLVAAFVAYCVGENALSHAHFIPPNLHPAARVIARIPFATVVLALALHAPNAL